MTTLRDASKVHSGWWHWVCCLVCACATDTVLPILFLEAQGDGRVFAEQCAPHTMYWLSDGNSFSQGSHVNISGSGLPRALHKRRIIHVIYHSKGNNKSAVMTDEKNTYA
jgi:hypothetical protein